MDITLKIHRYIKTNNDKYIMTYVPQSVCYTECPESLKDLTRQRIRWQKAFVDCVKNYILKMFTHFNAGVSLFFIFDFLILGTLTSILVLLVPLFIILTKKVSLIFIIFFSADFLVGIIEGIVSVIISARYDYRFLKKDLKRVGCFIPLQLLSFRFLNIFFIIVGTIAYFINQNGWDKTDRLGRTFHKSLIKAKNGLIKQLIDGMFVMSQHLTMFWSRLGKIIRTFMNRIFVSLACILKEIRPFIKHIFLSLAHFPRLVPPFMKHLFVSLSHFARFVQTLIKRIFVSLSRFVRLVRPFIKRLFASLPRVLRYIQQFLKHLFVSLAHFARFIRPFLKRISVSLACVFRYFQSSLKHLFLSLTRFSRYFRKLIKRLSESLSRIFKYFQH